MVVIAIVTAGVGACATRGKPCEPGELAPEIAVVVTAGQRLNQDSDERSLPTWVRLYQLRGTGTLEQAEFEATWADAKTTLADALLTVEERVIHPGQALTWTIERKPEAKFLAAVALYREPAGAAWRASMRLPEAPRCKPAKPAKPPKVYVTLEGSAVRVGAVDPRPRATQGGPG